jgi:hypothetical protein
MAHTQKQIGEKDIHNRESEGVRSLMPFQLRENSATLIALLEDYYTYLNLKDQPTNLIDRIQFEHDIDCVDDKYLNEIKNEIAKGVPDSTVLTNRQLFRKIVEYYYTRGSQNSAEVFFKLFFDDNITLTYPKETLLKPSDGAIREYGFVENTSAKVPYSTVSGDFITPKDISAEAGMLPVRVSNSIMPDGVTDAYWINGLYTFNRTTQRFEKDANNYFYFNTTVGRWYYHRNETTFRYAYDTSGASQTDGFWSIPSGSWEGYISATATDLGVSDGAGGFQFPYTDNQSKRSTAVEHNLNTATNRGRNKTTDTVLEHKENEGEYLISYGHLETAFWKYNKPATNTVVAYAYSWILNADGKPDSTTTSSFHPDYNSWHQAKAQLSYCGAKGQKMIQHSVTRTTGAGVSVNVTVNPADILDETVVNEYSSITSSDGQIRLGTHDSNTTVYKKDENDNVSVFESPTTYPYSKAISAPEQTILFADKGIGIEAQGRDHYVLSLNAHGKELSAINFRSTNEAVILGYALEDCEIEMWQIPLASSRYLGNRESIMQQGMRFEGPYADPVDYVLGTSNYFGGRKHHQWYEVVEPGNYTSHINFNTSHLLRKINGVYKSIPIASERSKLLAGDRFLNTSSSNRGVNFLQGGLKVKRCATKTIRVKAGEKFSFIEEPTSSMPYFHAFYLKSTGNIVASITQENETEDNYQIMPTTDKAIIRGDGYELSVDGVGSISGEKITSAALASDGYVTINHSLSTRHLLLTGQYVNIRDLKAADGTTNFSKLTSGTYNGMSTDPNGLNGPIEFIDSHSFKYPLFKTYFNSSANRTGTAITAADQTSRFFPGMKIRSPYLAHFDRQADPAIYASQTFATALVNGSSGFSTGTGNNITIDNQHGTPRVGMFVHTDDIYESSTGKILYGAGQGAAKETGRVVATGTNTIQIAPYTFTATTVSGGTSGATVVINITSNKDFPLQGMTVTGTNVPAGTIVVAPSTNAQALNSTTKHGITMSNSASSGIPNNTTLTFSTVLPATLPNNRLLKFSTPVLQDQTITSVSGTGTLVLSKSSGASSSGVFTYKTNFPYVAEGGLPTGLSAVSYSMSTDSDSPSISEAVMTVARINNTYIDNRGNEERPIAKRQNVFAFDPGDGAGADATSHLPLKMCKDTYVIPHKISDWAAITSYTNKWVVSYWRSDNVVPGNNQWVVFESVSRPNTADNAVQLQYKPTGGSLASGLDPHFAISSLQTIGTVGTASVVNGKQVIEFAGGSRTGTIRVGQRFTQALTSAKSVGAQNKTAGQQVLIDGISAGREVVVGQRVQGTGISGTVLIATIVTQSGQSATITLNGNINVANDADLAFNTMGIDNDVYVTKTFQPHLGNDLPSGFASPHNTFEVSEAVTVGVGTDIELKTEPNLWKFEAINPFALFANDESDDEELYYGFNRNTYNKAVYSFYSDYDDRKGFVSDQNKVHDGDFNQEYSYGVNTSISLNKWEPQYKKLVHPSGTKMFGLLRLEGTALKLTESAYDGGSTYDLSDGSWINNLHLPVGQHTPYYQPGWLDEITSAEVLISPFETFGAAAFNSAARSTNIGQKLNSSYTLTAPNVNGALTEIKLVTTNVCTNTPITISTLNLTGGDFLKTMPRLTARNLALSQIGTTLARANRRAIPETGGNGNWQVSEQITSGNQRYIGGVQNFIDNHTDTGNNFSAGIVLSDDDPDWRNANNDDQIISLVLNINANGTGFKQNQVRIYGLISGRKYKVTGEWRLLHNTITNGATVNVGLDISDNFVDENNSSTTRTHDGSESNNISDGSTTSFASYEITGTYSDFNSNVNGGRLNFTGTHNFVDLRLTVNKNTGTYSGKAVAQFKNFKIEEYYGEEITNVFSSVFDTAVPANSNDSDTNRTDRLTNFTVWSNPISGLASNTIIPSDGVEYTVFDLPNGASCKLAAGQNGICNPIALDGKTNRDFNIIHGSQLVDAFSGSTVRNGVEIVQTTFNFNV